MEAKELHGISISSLAVSLFGMQWSKDNHISVITDRGVYVLELNPSPLNTSSIASYSRSFVYPSDIIPALKFESVVDSILWGSDREELYSLLMEEAITPRIENLSDAVWKIIGLAWSPLQLVHPNRCFLAVITSVGALEILVKEGKNWLSACDLSAEWYEQIRAEVTLVRRNKNYSGKQAYDPLTTNVRRVLTTAVVWSELYRSAGVQFAYLVAAYRSSDIAVWKVAKITNLSDEVAPTIAFRTNLNKDAKITALKWIELGDDKHVIVVGYHDGTIDGLLLQGADGNLSMQSTLQYYAHRDGVAVNCIEVVQKESCATNIFVSKNSFLLTLKLDSDGTLLGLRYLQLETFSISGLTVVDENRLLVTTQDGAVHVIETKEDRLTSEPLKHNFGQSDIQYLGLASSPNKTLFASLSIPKGQHDHLITREPSTICFFGLDGKRWDPLTILTENTSQSLVDHWDCLEAIRVKSITASEPLYILPSVPDDLESLSIYELRVAMWTSVIADACKRFRELRRNESIVGEISDVQPLIFVHSISAFLLRLTRKESLTKEQRVCIGLLRSYLEVYLAGEEEEEEEEEEDEGTPVSRHARQALNSTTGMNCNETETCDLCGEIISDIAWNLMSCPKGHRLPRCALTLLQISASRYRSCPICGQMFHPSLDTEFEEPRCPFCDVPALYDSRVLEPNSVNERRRRNLSQRQTSAAQIASQSQGTEESVEENVTDKESSSSKSRTFAVIVNDENEPYNITETWQEF